MPTYTQPLSAALGRGMSGQTASYRVIDAGGTTRIARTSTGVSERLDAAGNATTGTFAVSATFDTDWAFPVRVIWDVTGQAGVAADEVITDPPLNLRVPAAAAGASGGAPTLNSDLHVPARVERIGSKTLNLPVGPTVTIGSTIATENTALAASGFAEAASNAATAAGDEAGLARTILEDLSINRLTAIRAAYLDKLAVAGLVASAADIAAITQAQRVRIVVPPTLERPDAGSEAYRIWIYAYDERHRAEDLDSNPTVTAEDNTGASRTANLGAVVKPGGTTGVYYVDYNVSSAHDVEGIVLKVTATEGGAATEYAAAFLVVDTTAVDFTSADRNTLNQIAGRVPAIVASQSSVDSLATAVGNIDDLLDTEVQQIIGLLDTEITSILTAVQATTPTAIRDAIFAQIIEGTITFLQAMRANLASSIGDIVNIGGDVYDLRSPDGTKTRVRATIPEVGTRDVTATDLT